MRAGAVAALLLAGSLPGFAQTKASPAAVEAAREIIALKGGGNIFESLIPSVIEQGKNSLLQQNPGLEKDLNQVSEQLRQFYAPRMNDVMTEIATFYASHFTEEELKQLVTFYRSPLGKKVVSEEPRAIEKSMSFAQNWAVKFVDEVLGKMREEMKKKGHNL